MENDQDCEERKNCKEKTPTKKIIRESRMRLERKEKIKVKEEEKKGQNIIGRKSG